MAKKGLGVAIPPPRRKEQQDSPTSSESAPERQERPQQAPAAPTSQTTAATAKKGPESTVFDQRRGSEKVQMNISVDIETRSAFQIMAIRLDRKAADLFAEAVRLLEEKYGSV